MRIATAGAFRRVICAASLVAALITPNISFATPSTPQIAARQKEAAAAQAKLKTMNNDLEVQVEQYNAVTEALGKTRIAIEKTQADLNVAEQDLAQAQQLLGTRAAEVYKSGGSNMLDVILGATSFTDFMIRMDLAVRINRSDANVVARVKDARARVEGVKLSLEQRESEQISLRSDMAARADVIRGQVAAQQAFVSQLNAQVKNLIAQEEERLRKIAEERARRAAALLGTLGTSGERAAAAPGELGPGHPEVVAIAMQFVGKDKLEQGVPYLWGGTSPKGFDCSGLVWYCYRQLGIDLPRTALNQYSVGKHIAASQSNLLRPGDLVFFGTNRDASLVHHVGIYAGNGMFIEAPYTGSWVRVSALADRADDYVGASRIP